MKPRRTAAVITTGAALAAILVGLVLPEGLQGTSTASASLPLSSSHGSSSYQKTTRRGIRVILPSIYDAAPLVAVSSVIDLNAWTTSPNFNEPAPIVLKGDFLGSSALEQTAAAVGTIRYTEILAADAT